MGMTTLAARLVAAQPAALAVISPHAPRRRGAFGIWGGPRLHGSFTEFGAGDAAIDLPNALDWVMQLKAVCTGTGLVTWNLRGELDHGALVPLWYLVQAGWKRPTLVLSLNYPGEGGLAELGRALARAAAQCELRVAVLASGDLSHRLAPRAPGGYQPRASEFDLTFVAALRKGALADLERLDPELVELAGEDALDSTRAAVASVNAEATGHGLLSYEAPFGVGYGVAVLFDQSKDPVSAAVEPRDGASASPAPEKHPGEQADAGPRRRSQADYPARWWTMGDDGRLECELCPRFCKLHDGQHGFCYVRQRRDDRMVLNTYGRTSGFCVDPIEKKPLHHFYPGSSALSFGTVGCNLGCRFCQNWDITKTRDNRRLSSLAAPETIARAAQKLECTSVAFTYNDPVVFAEYAIDVALACHERHVQTVAVTAGYITSEPRMELFQHIDAANVDLKGFSEEFYHRLCLGQLAPVLDTLEYLHRETGVWLEVTSLLIPGANDDEAGLHYAADWFAEHLGPDVPWHFTAFHPDYNMLDTPSTPVRTLEKARAIALSRGLHYVYTGNVEDPEGSSTRCPRCRAVLVERNRYELSTWNLAGNRCRFCERRIAGRFSDQPGHGVGRPRPIMLHEE